MKPQGWTPDMFLFPTLPLINGRWEQCKRKGFNLSCFALSLKIKLLVLTAKLEPLCGKQCYLFINGRSQGSHSRSWKQLRTGLWVSLVCFETQGLWFSLFFSSHSNFQKYPIKLRSAPVREAGRRDDSGWVLGIRD